MKAFTAQLERNGLKRSPLFFAKVDVSACFDTIPQERVVELVAELLSTEYYQVDQHALIKGSQSIQSGDGLAKHPPRVKFYSEGRPAGGVRGELNSDHKFDSGRRNCVYVGPLAQQSLRKQQVLKLLEDHVERNLVKIGKKYYRQRNGIPQGSILSSLLCNFFYGKLEQELMTCNDNSVMLRLIDDFLFVTTERQHAEDFLRLLHKGIPAYGVSVKPEKSLVNFDVDVDGRLVPKCSSQCFPYCGLLIDQISLDIKRDAKQLGVKVADSLTVEYSTLPGRTFHRKALNAFKIKFHAMFLDTNFNALQTVVDNLYLGFHEAASRMLHYLRCLPHTSHPSERLIIGKFLAIFLCIPCCFAMVRIKKTKRTVLLHLLIQLRADTTDDLIRLAWKLMRRKQTASYHCSIRKSQARW